MIAGAAWRSCTGANAHTTPARPAAAAQPGQHVVARLAALAGDDADHARQRRARQPLLRLEQALGVQRAAQPRRAGPAGRPRRRSRTSDDREGERRRGGARARVVVAAAGGDDLGAVGERRRARARPSRLRHIEHGSAPAPSRSSNHTLRAAGLEADHLAEDLHAGELAQPLAQRGPRSGRPGTARAARSPGCRPAARGAASRRVRHRSPPPARARPPAGRARTGRRPACRRRRPRTRPAGRRAARACVASAIASISSGVSARGRALAVAAEERVLARARRVAVARRARRSST